MSNSAYDYALKLLVRREHSAFELQQKLQLKGYNSEDIAEALVQLQQQNYQSDERFAEMIVRTRVHQGKGELLITQELKQHQVDNPERFLQDIDFFVLCRQVKVKKFGEGVPKDIKEKQKQQRFLQGRGFGFAEIKQLY